jgi:hypothetical protein
MEYMATAKSFSCYCKEAAIESRVAASVFVFLLQ